MNRNITLACLLSTLIFGQASQGKTGSLAVTVQTEDGNAITEADVEVLEWSGVWDSLGKTATTDKEGESKIEGLPTGEYLTVVVRAHGFAPTQQDFELGEKENRSTVVRLSRAVSSWLRIVDEEQKPIGGAEVYRLSFTDANQSSVYLNSKTLGSLYGDITSFSKSDEDGRLELPPLPAGAKVTAWAIHPKLAPGKQENVLARDGEIGTVNLKKGVPVRVEFNVGSNKAANLDGTEVDVTFYPNQGGSQSAETIMHQYRIADNAIEFTASPTMYRYLRVVLDDYIVTSVPSNELGEADARLNLRDAQSSTLPVTIHPKVKAKGRVVDGDGNPIGGVWVSGTVASPEYEKPIEAGDDWSGWVAGGDATTDSDGYYEIDLISADAQIEAIHEGYFGDPSLVEFNVAETKQIPSMTLRPVPLLRGRVLDSNGKPAVGMIVRFRCTGRSGSDPIGMTDGQGKFELKLSRIPYLPIGLIGVQTDVFVIAFDPKSNQAGRAAVDLKDLSQTSDIEIKLAEKDSDWIVNPLQDQLEEPSETMLRIAADLKESDATQRKLFAGGLPGKILPDMSNGTWLNSEANSLEDFRGKYVLLDFWFIGCGPCHADMPSVKMAQKVYSDLGFSVVSFHIKSQTPANVKKFADANGMTYPIVVDNSDGEIEAEYRKLGLSGFPHYILLDPEGKVLNNGCFWNPDQISLRRHKLELIHQAIHGK